MNTRNLTLALGVAVAVVVFGSGCSKQSRFERALATGDTYLAEGQYDLAQDSYEIALRFLPDDHRAVGRLGVLGFRQGKLVPAYVLLQRALKDEPNNLELQLALAQVAQGLARSTEARQFARKVLESQPAREEAMLVLAETCASARDVEETRVLIEASMVANPTSAGPRLALGALRLAQRDQAGAESELRKALELNPKSAAVHSYLASLHLARGEAAETNAALRRASELDPLRSTRRLKYIDHLLRTGSADEGKKLLVELTTKAPDYIPGLVAEMNLAHKERRFDAAGAIADKILVRDPTSHDALSQRAASKIAVGNLDGGILALKMMEELYEHSALVKYRLAHAHLRKGDTSSALDSLNKAIRLAPEYDEAILLLAETQLARGNHIEALASLKDLLKRQPRLPRAYVLLAQAHHAAGDTAQCLAILRSYAQAFPKAHDGHYFSARVLAQVGQNEEARRALERCAELAPDFWPAAELLVNEDLVAMRTDAAKTRAQALLEKFPAQSAPLMLDAKVALQERDEKRAEARLQKAIELAPNDPQAYVFLARVYLASQQPQQAVSTMAALAEKKNEARTFMQLGVLNGSLGHHEAARVAYEKALAVDPKFVPALNNLASVLSVNLGQVDAAVAPASKAYELAPADPQVADTLGWIHHLKGRHEAALPLLRAAAERLPAEPIVHYHLGVVHYRLGQEESAMRALKQIATDRIDPAVAKSVEEHLATLAIDGATAGPDVRQTLEARAVRDPNDPVILTRLASIEARTGSPEKAVTHYEAALKISPKSVPVLAALVELHAAGGGNAARALELARSAFSLAPHQHDLAWKLGRTALQLGDAAWAATALRSAAGSVRDQPELLFDLARATYAIGQTAEAQRALGDALMLPVADAGRAKVTALADMISAASSPAAAAEALPQARKILALEPDHLAAQMVSALAQEHAKDYKGAAESHTAMLARVPAFVPAVRQLTTLFADHLGNDAKAAEYGARALQALPDDPAVTYSMGTVSYRRGDYGEAARLLRISGRKRDRHAETFFYLGMAEFHLKNTAESRTQLQRAVRLNLPPAEAAEAKRVLEQLARS